MINWFDVPSESPNKDLTLKNLKVSENGTYGESGVAYSSVEVDVNGGSGGDSDFSTIEVTVTTGSTETEYLMLIPIINTESNCSDAIVRFGGQLNEHLIVPLYKGKAFANVNGQYSVTVTGDAEFDDEEYIVTITGNCTISLS